jgi:hypothetical protein
MLTKPGSELSLFDTLSRLSFTQASKLLGPRGNQLITTGGKHEIDIPSQVKLSGDQLRVAVNGSSVTIDFTPTSRGRLKWSCDTCETACEHAGAAFSLILEEKLALGLADAPPEREPVESRSEEALVSQAITEREERARTEKMRCFSVSSTAPCGFAPSNTSRQRQQ